MRLTFFVREMSSRIIRRNKEIKMAGSWETINSPLGEIEWY